MKDLSEHQRDILIAMLQGRDIEVWRGSFWVKTDYYDVLELVGDSDERLRISGNQDEAVRLYGVMSEVLPIESLCALKRDSSKYDNLFIDISPNGFIVGGKIGEAK